MNYTLRSCKGCKTVDGDLATAIAAAKEMDAELQPAFGIDIDDAEGNHVATVEGDDVEVND